METYGDYIKVEESETLRKSRRRRTASDLIKDSITYGNIGKAEDLMKDQVMRKVDAYLPLVRRKEKKAKKFYMKDSWQLEIIQNLKKILRKEQEVITLVARM